MFVPVKENKKKEKNDTMVEAVKSFNRLIDNDPTKELINFLKEDNEKSRQHELELFKVQMQSQMQMQMLQHFSGYGQTMPEQRQWQQRQMTNNHIQSNTNNNDVVPGAFTDALNSEQTYFNF